MMNMEDLGQFMKRRRKSLRIDQKELARVAGISIHAISDMESGKGNPTLETLNKLFDALGLTIKIEAGRND